MMEPSEETTAPPKSPRQTRMGPAPFASFEDVSDESPEDKPIIRLPDISEDTTPMTESHSPLSNRAARLNRQEVVTMDTAGPPTLGTKTLNLQTPSTPRIDISRASSSSQHESRDSSPENGIFGEGDKDAEGNKLGLGFREDGTADLRSSTEELAFLEPNTAMAEKETSKQQPSRKSPLMFNKDNQDPHRKDSQCSDIVLLSISGRTSRLSSIGSQGSAHSNVSAHSNISHISGQSRLSVISGVSRSPSPHKMLLETSFCGPKPLENDVGVVGTDKHQSEILEQVLLSRKHDPREAILAEGISVAQAKEQSKPTTVIQTHAAEKLTISHHQAKPANIRKQSIEANSVRRLSIESASLRKQSMETAPVISLSTLGKSYKNGDKKTEVVNNNNTKTLLTPKPVNKPTKVSKSQPTSARTNEDDGELTYIRIKLKPDHMYDDYDSSQQSSQDVQKPDSLNLKENTNKNAQNYSQNIQREDSLNRISRYDSHESSSHVTKAKSSNASPSVSPKLVRKSGNKEKDGSRTPSPSPGVTVSRKSSFCSLFKSKETMVSPESPTGSTKKKNSIGNVHSSRSRSKSKERDKSATGTPTSTGKGKGSMLAIFKPRKSSASASPVARESLPNLDGIQISSDYKFSSEAKSVPSLRTPGKERLKYYDAPVDGSIRIPLHTPSDEDEKTIQAEVTHEKEHLAKEVAAKDNMQQIKIDRPKSAPSSSRPSVCQPSTSMSEKHQYKKTSADSKQIVLPDGSIRIPLHSPSEDKFVRCDLLSKEEAEQINKLCSNISTKKGTSIKSNKSDRSSVNSIISSTDVSKCEDKPQKDKVEVIYHIKPQKENSNGLERKTSEGDAKNLDDLDGVKAIKITAEIISAKDLKIGDDVKVIDDLKKTPIIEPEIEFKPEEEKLSNQAKKHIIFTTKVGSKDQIFSMQFSLSKTDSQCSQMSDNKSQISEESVIEVQISEKRGDDNLVECAPVIENICEPVNVIKDDLSVMSNDKSFKSIEQYQCNEPSETIESQEQLVLEKLNVSSPIDKISHSETPSRQNSKETPLALCRKSAFAESISPRTSVQSNEDYVIDSSESERDSELDFIRRKQLQALEKAGLPEPEALDHERKGLVLQQESFDDELPYIPTTLPLERSVAVPIVPVKQRQTLDMKTFPIDRPRSTTPIAPSCLEEYCSDEVYTPDSTKMERLKISLPEDKTPDKTKSRQRTKSPRRISTGSGSKTWAEFAEQGIAHVGTRKSSASHESDSDPAPPLPPRAPVPKSQWINFEEIPEKRKLPKRIQTIPSRTNIEVGNEANVVYAYVNPEDCKCECHESGKDGDVVSPEKEEDEEPLLDDGGEHENRSSNNRTSRSQVDTKKDRRSLISDSSIDYSSGRDTSDSPQAGRPFRPDSNRSSLISQEGDRSSSSGSPNERPSSRRR